MCFGSVTFGYFVFVPQPWGQGGNTLLKTKTRIIDIEIRSVQTYRLVYCTSFLRIRMGLPRSLTGHEKLTGHENSPVFQMTLQRMRSRILDCLAKILCERCTKKRPEISTNNAREGMNVLRVNLAIIRCTRTLSATMGNILTHVYQPMHAIACQQLCHYKSL